MDDFSDMAVIATFMMINHYIIRFAYLMAWGQSVVTMCVIQKYSEIQRNMLSVNDHLSALGGLQKNPLDD